MTPIVASAPYPNKNYMAFPQAVIDRAFALAKGRCERCSRLLDPNNKILGKQWDAHHKTSQAANGSDGLSNCEILCISCHEKTNSYGRP